MTAPWKLALKASTRVRGSPPLRMTSDKALSEDFFEVGVLPYYLHLLDPVAGVEHFRVETQTARQIMHQLRARLPGFLVPQLVQEEPGEDYKLSIL